MAFGIKCDDLIKATEKTNLEGRDCLMRLLLVTDVFKVKQQLSTG